MDPADARDNVYENAVVGATVNPVMPAPDAIDEQFAQAANAVLRDATQLARVLLGAHQSAMAIIVDEDWKSMRKYFSLSDKYAAWADYKTPATGYGIHGWLLSQKRPVRLTQPELEANPEYKNFGTESGKHPPLRGWLAVPLLDETNRCWGLLQLSDKYEGEFSEMDEAHAVRFARLVTQSLGALWEVRNYRKKEAGLPT